MPDIKVGASELLYAFSGFALLLVWFLWLRNVLAPVLGNMHPFLALIIYNAGLLVALFLLTSVLSSKVARVKLSVVAMLVFMGLDIIIAPYLVATNGVVNTSAEYWFVSSDAAVGSLFNSFFGPSMMTWVFTYIIVPFILVFVLPIIIYDPHKISKMIGM